MSRFDDLTPVEQDRLRLEFENRDTTHGRRVEILTMLQEGADETKFLPPCVNCKHVPFYAPWHEAVIEGHVYSNDGLREISITGYCEFCFDEITAEPDKDEQEGTLTRLADALGYTGDEDCPNDEHRLNTCHNCTGSGIIEDFDSDRPCPRCDGRGHLHH